MAIYDPDGKTERFHLQLMVEPRFPRILKAAKRGLGLSMAQIIRDAVYDYVYRRAKTHKKLARALEDANERSFDGE